MEGLKPCPFCGATDCISRADVEQTVEDNILCYTHSDRPIDQDADTECHMAIRMALKMLRKDLRKLPSAQPADADCWDCNCQKMERSKEKKTFSEMVHLHDAETHEERTETHACDLISRQALMKEFSDFVRASNNSDFARTPTWNDAVSLVGSMPSAQPEPDIIACGDCKHWICHDRRCGYWNHGVKPLDWCCHGERRTDE